MTQFLPHRHVRAVASRSVIVFLSTLAVQASTFLVVFLGGFLMSVEEFARLNLIVATAAIVSLLLDLGLNVTMTKYYGETGDRAYLAGALVARLSGAALAVVIGLAAYGAGYCDFGAAVAIGAAMSLWSGARASNQAEDQYGALCRESLVLAALRTVAAVPLMYLLDGAGMVALLAYAAPIVVVTLPQAFRQLHREVHQARTPLSWPSSRLVSYAGQVYINQLAFSVLPYVSLYVVNLRLTDIDVGKYGISVAFLAPLVLVINSVRSVLLPVLVGPDRDLERILCSRMAGVVLLAAAVAGTAGCAVFAWGVEFIYQSRFPGVWQPLFILMVGTTVTGVVGLYSLLAHRQNRPHLLVIINLARLAAAAIGLWIWGVDLLSIALVVSAVMIIGEVVLAAILIRGREA